MAVGDRRGRSPPVKRPTKTRTPAQAQAMPSGKPRKLTTIEKGIAAGKKAMAKAKNSKPPPVIKAAAPPPPPSRPSGGGGPKIAPRAAREPRARRAAPRVGRSKKKGPRV